MEIPEHIEVAGGEAVTLAWPDGTKTTVTAPVLRAACQCAGCTSAPPVPIGADVRITNATLVGAYAINFTFAPDDHHTGIYPFDRLRVLGETGRQ